MSEVRRVLLAETDRQTRVAMRECAARLGFELTVVTRPARRLADALPGRCDVAVVSMSLAESGDAIELLRDAVAVGQGCVVAIADATEVTRAYRAGVHHVVRRPEAGDPGELTGALVSALAQSSLLRRPSLLPTWTSPWPDLSESTDPGMGRCYAAVESAAVTGSSVWFDAASGSRVRWLAERLHRRSATYGGPFVAVACAATPQSRLAPMFNDGEVVRQARGGTLFVADVDALSAPLRASLAATLATHRGQLRVVASIDGNVANATAQGQLGQYLDGERIAVPRLCERTDLAALALDRINRINEVCGTSVAPQPSPAVQVLLARHGWPGDSQEFDFVLTSMVLRRHKGALDERDVPGSMAASTHRALAVDTRRGDLATVEVEVMRRADVDDSAETAGEIGEYTPTLPESGVDLRAFMHRIEYALIDQALGRADGNKSMAARLLGMNRTTLIERIKKRDKR